MSATVSKWEVVGVVFDLVIRLVLVVDFIVSLVHDNYARAGIVLGMLGLLALQDIYKAIKDSSKPTTINITSSGKVTSEDIATAVRMAKHSEY